MGSINFTIIPPKKALSQDVECFRIAEHGGKQGLAIKVCPNGFPGIVFQHSNGKPTIENIITNSGRVLHMPDTLFVYGQVTELSVMNFKQEPYITVQAILKPHAIKTLLGMDASKLLSPLGISPQKNSFLFTLFTCMIAGERGRSRLYHKINLNPAVSQNILDYQKLIAKNFNSRNELIPLFTDQELKSLKMSVVMFLGEKDIIIHVAKTAKRLRSLLPNARISILPSVGHTKLILK